MILVRLVFQAKFGRAAELARLFKEAGDRVDIGTTRILTDLSGPQDTVVTETEVESLAAWERRRVELFSRPEYQETLLRALPLVESGRTEFYTIETDS